MRGPSQLAGKLLPKPIGAGRGVRYDDRHVLRARVVQHLRAEQPSLRAIRAKLSSKSDKELAAMLPKQRRKQAPDGPSAPPPEPSYPSVQWEHVQLTEGLVLMVNPAKGPPVRRLADEIHRYYGAPSGLTG